MSASNKKKLHADPSKVTEKQMAEHNQDKELKMYTIGFTVVMALVLVIAIVAGSMQLISNSGVREKKTIAYTVGDHQISSAEFNYFYTDTVNNFMNQFGSYISMTGLDTSKPLDEQFIDDEKTMTWADNFVTQAKESAKAVYAIADEARAKGHSLSQEEMDAIDAAMENLELYGQMNGLGSAGKYLKAIYGNGSTEKSYRAYLENSMLADTYRAAYTESLTYEDADFRAHEKDNYDQYSSFTYNQYYLPADKFLEGGTTDAEGNVTFSQEEKDASVKACEEAAKELTSDKVKSAADMDKLIAALPMNKDAEDAASTHYDHSDYRNMPGDLSVWLADSSRKAGDKTYIANKSTTQDEEGKEVTHIGGYTVLMFESRDDNKEILPNVRHILVSYEGGTTDENGTTTYTDEEKAAAKEKAEALLKKFEDGEKTEDAFAALATENTMDPGSKENGGLYENVYRGQMVPTFNDWVFENGRKAGDTGIVATEYGYHVMYFCGDGSLSYRDTMIRAELSQADVDAWYKGLVEAAVTADGDTSLLRTDMVIGQ